MAGYSDLTSRAIIGKFFQRYEDTLSRGWSGPLAFYSLSNQESEIYKFLGLPPSMREWVGDRLEKAFNIFSQTIVNKVYEFTLPIDVDDLRRDKTSQIMLRIGQTAERAAEHVEKLLSTLIEANPICYDGQNFFDTDHSSGDSGTQTNSLTNSDVPALDVVTAAKPTVSELVDIILGMIQIGYGYKDDQGEPINGGARAWTVMAPVNMYANSVAAVSVERIGSGASNPLLSQRFSVDVVPNPRLTSTTVMYVYRTDAEAKPFIWQEELPLQAQMIGAGSEEEFKNNRWLFGGKAIRNVGPGIWQYAIKGTLS